MGVVEITILTFYVKITMSVLPGAVPPAERTLSPMSSFDPASLLGGYTQEELEAAFALVAPADHWKNPIKASLPASTPALEIKKVAFAIEFFTGGKALVRLSRKTWDVTAPGYYASVGA